MFDFIKWCFRSENSTFATIIILIMIGSFVIEIARIIKKKRK